MTQRIIETAQVHATNIFSGYIRDELTSDELLTPSNISRITFKRFRVVRSLVGNSDVEIAIDVSEIQIDPAEYRLYPTIQSALPESTNNKPYTFIWVVPESREPFFAEVGKYILEIKFYPYMQDELILKLPFEITVT
jgi:hypothetical protein